MNTLNAIIALSLKESNALREKIKSVKLFAQELILQKRGDVPCVCLVVVNVTLRRKTLLEATSDRPTVFKINPNYDASPKGDAGMNQAAVPAFKAA